MTATRRDWKTGVLALASIAALALLSGCAQSPPIKGQYVLEPPNPPLAASTHPGMLRVGTVGIGAPYRGRAFVFRETDLKYETDFYHEFLVAPTANIGEATARALAAAKVFAAVAPSGVVSDADWVLEAFVDRLYGDGRVKAKPVAVLSITYFLRRADSDTGLPVWSKTYERQVPFEAASARAYVGALNGAFGEIVAELARDLTALSLPAK
jgi:cholesterol transport system auxiliary component